jgi:hypothetical protein
VRVKVRVIVRLSASWQHKSHLPCPTGLGVREVRVRVGVRVSTRVSVELV